MCVCRCVAEVRAHSSLRGDVGIVFVCGLRAYFGVQHPRPRATTTTIVSVTSQR